MCGEVFLAIINQHQWSSMTMRRSKQLPDLHWLGVPGNWDCPKHDVYRISLHNTAIAEANDAVRKGDRVPEVHSRLLPSTVTMSQRIAFKKGEHEGDWNLYGLPRVSQSEEGLCSYEVPGHCLGFPCWQCIDDTLPGTKVWSQQRASLSCLGIHHRERPESRNLLFEATQRCPSEAPVILFFGPFRIAEMEVDDDSIPTQSSCMKLERSARWLMFVNGLFLRPAWWDINKHQQWRSLSRRKSVRVQVALEGRTCFLDVMGACWSGELPCLLSIWAKLQRKCNASIQG